MKAIADQILKIAQTLARQTRGFQKRKGPGKRAGNGVTNKFLKNLDKAVEAKWPRKVRRQEQAATGVNYSFDYYIPSERTAVEIALSLRNVVTEFEKDIFKAILAKQSHKPITKLLLIGKKGSVKRQNEPGPRAIKAWTKQNCRIAVEVRELT